jgi:hypothetical protein
MGSHLGWHFAVCCPLRAAEENLEKKHQKQLRKKNYYTCTVDIAIIPIVTVERSQLTK